MEEKTQEMTLKKEGHFDKATSTNENNLLLDNSPGSISSEKLADTVVLMAEHTVLSKRKGNLEDQVHGKKHKADTIEEVASDETSLDEQNNQETIENMFPECDLEEDSEGCNRENQNEKDHYSCSCDSSEAGYDDEVMFIYDTIQNEETFSQGAKTLYTWLDNGICSEKNARSFFIMIQCVHNHVMKLSHRKDRYEEIFKNAGEVLINHFDEISDRLYEAEDIYLEAQCIKYFTLAQRRSIGKWYNYVYELNYYVREKMCKLRMKEKAKNKRNAQIYKDFKDTMENLKEQRSSLQRQLKAVQDNIASMKYTYKKELEQLDDQLAVLTRAMINSQKVVLKLRKKCLITEVEVRELRNSIYQNNNENDIIPNSPAIPQDMARVIALISIFLHSCPGASIDSIHSYIHGIDAAIDCNIIGNVMRRFSMFQERSFGKWYIAV